MNRAQRRAHARLWPLLVLVMLAVSAAAIVAKARLDRAALGVSTSQVEGD